MPSKKLADLVQLLQHSETADKYLASEQRSNVLLVAGEHYSKRSSRHWNRVRETRQLTQEQKLRITKNHLQKIVKTYVNQLTSHAPGVMIAPNNEKETQDQKSAQLNQAVWSYIKKEHKIDKKRAEWADDFVGIGELCVKVSWDENKGKFLGYQQKVDDEGNPMFKEPALNPGDSSEAYGHEPEMVPDDTKAVFSGDFEFKRIFGFNLRRPNGVLNMDDAPWLCEVDMVRTKLVKSWLEDQPEKVNKITEDHDQDFYVFDGNIHGYDYKKGYSQINYMYWRPSKEYPMGYYYVFTKSIILFEGELPYGIFPLVYTGFDPIQTSPRHRSLLKQLRPYQIEINRCASKIAEHQVTLGDDKLLIQSGTKLTQGINYPGVRSLQYTGKDPIVMAGRSGAQYLDYMNGQISEMYSVANIVEEQAEKVVQGQDPWGQLFKSMREKKKFSLYSEKFERVNQDITELTLKLARHYLDENFLIPMVGKNEMINISEFKTTDPLSYSIKIEKRTEDFETQFGKQLSINLALQYGGKRLERQDIGKLMRAMPFGNMEEGFEDLTMDYDSGTNLILALDRGQQPPPSKYDDAVYMSKRLVQRMRMSDFQQLHPQIQQLYSQYKEQYDSIEVQRQQEILAAQADFIPTGGAMVKVDYYVPKKNNPDATERAAIPAEAVNWLIKRLDDQGSSQDRLQDMNKGAAAEMAAQFNQMQQRGQGQGNPPQA